MGIHDRYPQEVHDFVKAHIKGRRYWELAEMCNEALGTHFTRTSMHSFCTNHKYRNGLGSLTREECRKYHSKWPEGFYEFIVENSYGKDSKELSLMVKEKFGVEIAPANIKAYCQRYGIRRGINGWFQKGHAPGNKGKKWEEYLTPEAIEKSKKTLFKKGQRPPNYLPVGSITIVDGCKKIKVSEDGGQWDRWQPLNRYTWEQHHGPIPEGMFVAYKDGNPLNCDIDNLMLISRAENITLSKLGLRSDIPEITEAGVNIVRLKQKANKIRKNNPVATD